MKTIFLILIASVLCMAESTWVNLNPINPARISASYTESEVDTVFCYKYPIDTTTLDYLTILRSSIRQAACNDSLRLSIYAHVDFEYSQERMDTWGPSVYTPGKYGYHQVCICEFFIPNDVQTDKIKYSVGTYPQNKTWGSCGWLCYWGNIDSGLSFYVWEVLTINQDEDTLLYRMFPDLLLEKAPEEYCQWRSKTWTTTSTSGWCYFKPVVDTSCYNDATSTVLSIIKKKKSVVSGYSVNALGRRVRDERPDVTRIIFKRKAH